MLSRRKFLAGAAAVAVVPPLCRYAPLPAPARIAPVVVGARDTLTIADILRAKDLLKRNHVPPMPNGDYLIVAGRR